MMISISHRQTGKRSLRPMIMRLKLKKIIEFNLAQHAKAQFDVALCDRSDQVVTFQLITLIKKLTCQFSDYRPYISYISANVNCNAEKLKNHNYAFRTADWSGMNDSFERLTIHGLLF